MMITLMLWLVCCLVGTRKETLKNLSYITNFFWGEARYKAPFLGHEASEKRYTIL